MSNLWFIRCNGKILVVLKNRIKKALNQQGFSYTICTKFILPKPNHLY